MERVPLKRNTRARGASDVILTHCPACGYQFDANEYRGDHLGDHDPEDFGLTGGENGE